MAKPAAALSYYQRGISKKYIPLVLVFGNPLFLYYNKLGHKDDEQLRRDPALGESPHPPSFIPLFRPLLWRIRSPDQVCHYKDPLSPPMRSPNLVGVFGICPDASPDRIPVGVPWIFSI